jgi:glycosyltransferase involved in cell wall biosynthesis
MALSSKPTVVHVIDSLERGGAETLLVNLLPELNQHYDIILVTLTDRCDFDYAKIVCKKHYHLGYKSASSIPVSIWRLRRIIHKHRPSLVRAQLYASSLVARMATPKQIPLVFSIHTFQGIENYKKNFFSLPLEKITYYKRHHLIGVSQQAIDDFARFVGLKGPAYTLYNFINPVYFQYSRIAENINLRNLKLVAVGNLKPVKNYGYLIEAFSQLKDLKISLDIYGEGSLRPSLQKEIDASGANITLKGSCKEIYKVLPAYDLYVMSSLYEGFGIAPIEAMATGLPVLLSDLPVLREITYNNALFFNELAVESFIELIRDIATGKGDLRSLSANGIEIARKHYQQKDYVQKLNTIYAKVMAQQ